MQNKCLVHIFLIEKNRKFLLHTKITYDLRVCHDFDPQSLVKICKIRVRSISLLWRSIECQYFTRRLLMTFGCVRILTEFIWATQCHWQEMCKIRIRPYISYGEILRILLNTKIVNYRRICNDLDPRPFKQGQWQLICRIRVQPICFLWRKL